ncbi:MAG: hypothetical protein J5778_01370 [Clostridiales bacterium]|nr:hypothetical protein [Clostridiales bacterium]
MANNTRRKQTTRKKSSTKRASSQRSTQSRKNTGSGVGFGDYLHQFIKSKAFVPVITVLIIAVIIGLDFLFSLNDYNKFFTILGVELLIALICWIIAMLISFGTRKNSSNKG